MRRLTIFTGVVIGIGILFAASVYAGHWTHFKRRRRRLPEMLRDIELLHERALNILENEPAGLDRALEISFQRYAKHTLLMEGISPEDDSQLNSIRDATNYVINDFVLGQITEANIRTLHAHVVKFEDPQIAGQFRKIDVYVPVQRTSIFKAPTPFVAPRHQDVPALITDFLKWLNDQQNRPQTLENKMLIATEAKLRLVTIHPFEDGNGRASRALMVGLLRQIPGFPCVTIPHTTKQEYFSSLNTAENTGKIEPFTKFCLWRIEECFQIFIEDLSRTT